MDRNIKMWDENWIGMMVKTGVWIGGEWMGANASMKQSQ